MQPGTDIKRLKLFATFLSLLIVGTLAVAMAIGFAAGGRINTVQGDLDRFYAEAGKKGFHLAQIRSASGYGGFIHKFKNFVLRQDDRLVTAIEGDIRTLRAAAAGMNGVDLARAVQRTRPTIRVIFMSGYPDEATAAEGVPESGAPLLHKPFKTGELARVINEVLEGGQDRHILCA